MLRLFEKNMGLQTLIVLMATLLLWLPSLLSPQTALQYEQTGILYDLLVGWMPPIVAVTTCLILVATEGVILNLLLVRAGLTPSTSLLPTLLYILVMASTSTTLTPMVCVNGVLIVFIDKVMLRGTLLAIPVERICAATSLISICTMFYLPSLVLLVAYLLIAISYRLYSWRDWMALLLGLLAPYIVLCVILYLTNALSPWWQATIEAFSSLTLHNSAPQWPATIGNLWLAGVFVAGIVALVSQQSEHPVVWQKNAMSVAILSVGGLLILLFTTLFPIDMQAFAIPFALGVALLLSTKKNSYAMRGSKRSTWVKNIVFLLTIIAAVIC